MPQIKDLLFNAYGNLFKIFIPPLLALSLFVLGFFLVLLPTYKSTVINHKKEEIKELTNTIKSLLDDYQTDYLKGSLSLDEAKNRALKRIEDIRYGEDGRDYFWISDLNLTMLMHPYLPGLNNTDLSTYEDSSGKKLFVLATEGVREKGDVYIEYFWQWKDDSTQVVPKLSYFTLYKPWGWVVGTGVYLTELEEEFTFFRNKFTGVIFAIFGILLAFMVFSLLQTTKLENKRRMAEENYQKSVERYMQLFRNFPNPVYTISVEKGIYRFIDANFAAYEQTEGNVAKVFGKTVESIWGDDPTLMNAVHTTYETKSNYTLQMRYQFRTIKKVRDISFTFGYIPGDYVLVYFEDITDKKQYYDALQENEMKYRLLFENSNDAIFILDKELSIIDCNKKGQELQGYSREEIIGSSPFNYSPERQPNGRNSEEYAREMIGKTLNGKPQIFEWLLVNKDKTLKYTQVSMTSIKLGAINSIQVVVRDVTETRKLEQQLLSATVKAEENERERFAKELHDGVGPLLSTVKLYFQWLADLKDPAKKDTIVEKGKENIEEAIQSLREISNNLSPNILNMFGLIKAIERFSERVSDTVHLPIEFTSDLSKRLPKEVEITLYRVIIELINNTLKYANATKIQLDIRHDIKLNELYIIYEDDGVGMDLEKILPATKGLGLYNIQSRIKTLGGNITYHSDTGKGGFFVKIVINLNEVIEPYET